VARRLLLVIALVALVAGCGGSGRTVSTTTTRAKPKPKPHAHVKMAKLVITILDGDRRVRVPGASVRLGGKRGRTNRHGQTVIVGPRRKLLVSIAAHGYTTARYHVDFGKQRHHTLRVYDPRLQWPIFGATLARTQTQVHIPLRPPFRVIWSRGLNRLIEFPAVVDDGFAYIGNGRATIRAISMRSGKVAWRHDTPGAPHMASSPAVVGDEVVYHTMDGRVFVLDRFDGAVRWSWNGGSAIESSPIVREGIDYFGTWAGTVDALDLRHRRLRWSRSLGAKITSSAALSGGRLFIGDYDGRLWALRPSNGATLWTGQVNSKIYGTPAVSNGRVFVPASSGDSMTAFTTSGRYLWRDIAGYYVYSSPAVWDGHVCYGSYDGWFYGVSAATGQILWRVNAGGPISGAAVVVDGIAYAGTLRHRIIGVDVRTGRVVFTFPHGDFVPVSGNGMRLLLHGYSRLYAVEPRHTPYGRKRVSHSS
jgi:outer membrane protein assembly factor BamB